ncbi:hypothetical protein ABE48_06135 [Bacillus thuringiensis]|uniref:hypothetical protein n=1 Tax=Bacillus thuringiensis TaxID=1428 RepID=UPI0018CE72A3|nr:hypothetical protein [Bacillus thuringiensis]MBG9530780.1 hypothetical protein [Bacillus thuringiensis]
MKQQVKRLKIVSFIMYLLLGSFGFICLISEVLKYQWYTQEIIGVVVVMATMYTIFLVTYKYLFDKEKSLRLLVIEIPISMFFAIGVISSLCLAEQYNNMYLNLICVAFAVFPIILILVVRFIENVKFYQEMMNLLKGEE